MHPTGAVRARPLTCKRSQEIDALKSEIGEKDHLLQTQVQNMVRAPPPRSLPVDFTHRSIVCWPDFERFSKLQAKWAQKFESLSRKAHTSLENPL